MILVQTKIDLVNQAVITEDEVNLLANELRLPIFRVCAKENVRIKEVFHYLTQQYINIKYLNASEGNENTTQIQNIQYAEANNQSIYQGQNQQSGESRYQNQEGIIHPDQNQQISDTNIQGPSSQHSNEISGISSLTMNPSNEKNQAKNNLDYSKIYDTMTHMTKIDTNTALNENIQVKQNEIYGKLKTYNNTNSVTYNSGGNFYQTNIDDENDDSVAVGISATSNVGLDDFKIVKELSPAQSQREKVVLTSARNDSQNIAPTSQSTKKKLVVKNTVDANLIDQMSKKSKKKKPDDCMIF